MWRGGGVGVEGLDEGGAEEADGVGCGAGSDVDWDAGERGGVGLGIGASLARSDGRAYLSQIFQSLSERLTALASSLSMLAWLGRMDGLT